MRSFRQSSLLATLGAGLALALAAPAVANVHIPEGGAVTPNSVLVINFQVQEGCDGAATDRLEVTIPESISNPVPEDVPGWAEVLVFEDGADGQPRVAQVHWIGGPIQDGLFAEFGLRAGFPDELGGTVEFPVVQHCGLLEKTSNPTVALQPRLGPRDLIELFAMIEDVSDVGIAELAERNTGLEEFEPEQ